MSSRVRVSNELLDSARAAGETAGRTASEQLNHWIRLGREVERATVITSASAAQAASLAALRRGLLATSTYTYDTLAAARGASSTSSARSWMARQRTARRVFALTVAGRAVIPAFQFAADEQGRPVARAELAPILDALIGAGVNGWACWTWLTSATPLLSGDVPEQVASNDPPRALNSARRFVARSPTHVRRPGHRST